MFADGSNGSVELVGDSIIIRRKGLANILTQGVQGDKQIPLRSITAIQFRSAGAMMAGLIQFTIIGGREFRGGMLEATKDENAVMFSREQESAFLALRDTLQSQIGKPHSAPGMGFATTDLERLADLHERGHLTADEFAEAKKRVFSDTSSTPNSKSSFRESAPPPAPARQTGGCLKGFFISLAILFGFLILISLGSHK